MALIARGRENCMMLVAFGFKCAGSWQLLLCLLRQQVLGMRGTAQPRWATVFLHLSPGKCDMLGTSIPSELASAWPWAAPSRSVAAAGCSHPFRTTKAKWAFSPAVKWQRTQALPELKEAHFQGLRAGVGLNYPPGTFTRTPWSGAPLRCSPWPSALPVLWDELPVHDFYPLTYCLRGGRD